MTEIAGTPTSTTYWTATGSSFEEYYRYSSISIDGHDFDLCQVEHYLYNYR
jgi:hypothetical protein